MIDRIWNKRGSQMVEAAIVLPVVIIAIMLLIRLFTFYLQILCTAVNAHEAALREWKSYNGFAGKKYEATEEVEMIKGGLLSSNLKKTIEVKAYFYNEDKLVRTSAILK